VKDCLVYACEQSTIYHRSTTAIDNVAINVQQRMASIQIQ
jgi:hypothetical protein